MPVPDIITGADLTGKIALVTGSSGGIGAAVVGDLRRCGATVIGADRVGAPEGISGDSAPETFHDMDVTDEEGVRAVVEAVSSTHGKIDILVHAAGVLGRTGDPLAVSTAEFAQIMAINATGTFTVLREVGTVMKAAGDGSIVAFSSVAAKESRKDYLPYNASKIAVLHVVWSFAQILGPYGVNVNAVCPGPVNTAMWAQKAAAEAGGAGAAAAAAARADRAAQLPMGRFAEPEEVSRVVTFLVDPRNRYLTGLSVDVAGGAHLGMGS